MRRRRSKRSFLEWKNLIYSSVSKSCLMIGGNVFTSTEGDWSDDIVKAICCFKVSLVSGKMGEDCPGSDEALRFRFRRLTLACSYEVWSNQSRIERLEGHRSFDGGEEVKCCFGGFVAGCGRLPANCSGGSVWLNSVPRVWILRSVPHAGVEHVPIKADIHRAAIAVGLYGSILVRARLPRLLNPVIKLTAKLTLFS